MSNPSTPDAQPDSESTESFDQILSQFEQSHSRKAGECGKQLEGTVVTVTADSVLLDIGFKSEGILPLSNFQSAGESVKPGDKIPVSVKGRNPEGYYELTRFRTEQPRDWSALEHAFAEKAAIVGTVTGIVKGGVSVDVGVRAFMPASRSGARDAAELEKLVGQEIRCRIIKLDVTEEDIVVDQNLQGDARASLLVTQADVSGDPLGASRITLLGNVHKIPSNEVPESRVLYLARYENSKYWVDFEDFSFYRLEVVDLYFVGGFGVMGWVDATEYGLARPDPLADAAAEILDHMNADHGDALLLLAKGFAGIDAEEAAMTSVDRLGFHVRLKTAERIHGARIAFLREARTPEETRKVLVEMVNQVRKG